MPAPIKPTANEPATNTKERVLGADAVFVRDINELPLPAFIKAMVEDDLSGIVLSGTPTSEALKEAWEGLKEQYFELSLTEQGRISFFASVERGVEEERLHKINTLLYAAIKVPEPALWELLEQEGYGITISENVEDMKRQVSVLEARIKGEHLRLQLQQETPKEEGESKALTANFFYDILALYCKENKVHLKAKELTAGEFARYLKDLHEDSNRRRQSALRAQNKAANDHA